MALIEKCIMMHAAVTDVDAAKHFYTDILGFTVAGDSGAGEYRWLPLQVPGGMTLVLTNVHENMKPGTLKLYFATDDVAAAQQELSAKGAQVSEVKDDLYGPGSGVKWLQVQDPDGNQIFLVQA